MTVTLPTPGEDPWGDELNAAIASIDSRLTTVESLPTGGGGDGTLDESLSGAWFANRRWYALGTSLTYQNFYTAPLAALSGMVLHNLGANSGQLCKGGASGGNGFIWDQLVTVPTDAEVVTLETSNDWRLSSPLGTVDDPEDQSLSFHGALKAAFAWLLTNRPAARLFTLTNYTDAFPNTYPNFKGKNSQGKWYWEYNDVVRRVADIYGVPVIEVAREAGLNYYTAQWYTSDGLHLNALGGQRYAEYAWAQLRHLGWLTSRPTAPGGISNVAVSSVSVAPASVSLAPTQKQQFTSTVLPANATNKGVAWTSSNPAAVTIDGLGLATAVANGTATITATTTDGAKTATGIVTVAVAAATGVDVTPAAVSVGVGSTAQLTATVTPTNAGNKNVTWASDTPAKATVNASGLVTGVALGAAVVTATTVQGAFTDTTAVTVAASEWSLAPQTTFRQYGVTGLTATGSNPTYVDCAGGSGGPFGALYLNTPGHNAIEYAIGDGSKGGASLLGSSSDLSDWITLGSISAPFGAFDTKGSLSQGGFFSMGAPTPTALTPVGWGNNVVFRVGRAGTRVKIVRVDPGNVLVTIWDGDLDVNWGGAHMPRYSDVNLGVIAYGTPGSIHTMPVNCRTGVWTPP